MNVKHLISGAVEYAFFFTAFYWMRLPLHEWIHLQALLAMDGYGYIEPTIWGAHVIIEKMPAHPTILALTGGLGLGILFAAFAYCEWISQNIEPMAAAIPQAASELAYGVFEGLYLPVLGFFGHRLTIEQFRLYGLIIGATFFFAGLAFSLVLLLPHLIYNRPEGKT